MDKQLVQEINRLHAEICGGLSDAKRITILYALSEGSKNVMELAEVLALPQPTISRHLKILRERGMVVPERRGANIIYALSDKRIIRALDLLRQVLNDNLAHNASLVELTAK
ncbi:MAG: metalloregulator ArsR/SmtB family transcription factor [Anaerolineales bacterium]|nr:metalloregulator ArsR/SmtB family transcription factor [Anaerolineales bacterium]